MKKIIFFGALALALLFAQDALAEAADFAGFAASVGVNFTDGGAHLYGDSTDYQLGADSYRGNIDLSYSAALTDTWLLGAGISYDFGDAEVGSATSGASGAFQARSKLSDQFSIYVKPSYAITDKVAFFAKIGLHHADASYRDENGQLFSWPAGSFSQNTNSGVFGIGYGVGIMGLVTSHFFISGEISRVNFETFDVGTTQDGSMVHETPNVTEGILSVGYKF